MENKVAKHMEICKGLNALYERKNHDYGDSFHATFMEEGLAMVRIRLSDNSAGSRPCPGSIARIATSSWLRMNPCGTPCWILPTTPL